MEALAGLRLALVHDWLTGMRGGEKCLDVLCRLFPDAPLHTLIHVRGAVSATIEDRPIHASRLNRLPGVARYYRLLLPLMPGAANWRIEDCDAVLSMSHCVAKGAIAPAGKPHACYCFTPMRYAWHMREQYFTKSIKARLAAPVLARLRDWDRRTADRVSHFIAISRTVRDRIRECYGRESEVICPPVDTDFYSPAPVEREDYYLVVSAFAPYKRVDLAIEACKRLRKKLVIVGTGQDGSRLRSLVNASDDVQFLGWQGDAAIRDHLRRCRALLFPGEEDFGIVPLEANACGAPVIAYARGGATETILDGETGTFFERQTVDGLAGAIREFESMDALRPEAARRNAIRYGIKRYEGEMLDFLARATGRRESRRAA